MITITTETLSFLSDLAENNHRPWFDLNRKRYETARENILNWLNEAIPQFQAIEPGLVSTNPKDYLMRIFRDTRFSPDKTPYKTNFGVDLNPGGKKAPGAGYYLHIHPKEAFFGAGIWMPPADQLKAIREEIDFQPDQWLNLKKNLAKHNLVFDQTEKLSRPPKGFEKDNPLIEDLKLKSFIVSCPLETQMLTSEQLISFLAEQIKITQPLIGFLNQNLGIKE